MPRGSRHFIGWLALLLAVICAADSHVRIVSLSYQEGKVEVLPLNQAEWRPALRGTPLIEGEQLRVGERGRAEIEFECGSTLRLVPDSLVTFPALSLRSGGGRITSVSLASGTAFLALNHGDSPGFQLLLPGDRALTTDAPLKLRADVDEAYGVITLRGYDGKADVKDGDVHRILAKDGQLILASKYSWAASKALDADNDEWSQWNRDRDEQELDADLPDLFSNPGRRRGFSLPPGDFSPTGCVPSHTTAGSQP